MGLFDFFRSKNRNTNGSQSEKSPIEADLQGKFDLQLSNFSTRTHAYKVISVTVSPDFYELFPEAGQQTASQPQLSTSVVDIVFWGRTVKVTFNADDAEELIIKINDQLNWLTQQKHVVDEVIIRDLLPLKNGSWLDDDELLLTEERLIAVISLTSIDFDKKAGMSLHYDDGDLFGGHTIMVEISSKQKVKEAAIVG